MTTRSENDRAVRLESWMRCRDCRTLFRAIVAKLTDAPRRALCNGHVIAACPWCRPDSTPWKWGRGK